MVLDNFRTIELIWDKANKSIIKTIRTASSDTTGRYFSVKILDDGQEVTLNNAKLQLYWEHPNFNTSGTDNFNTVNNSGLFKMTFSKEMLTNIGELNAHLVLILPDGKITSDGFTIEVIKGADKGVVVPTNGSGLIKQIYEKIDKGNVTLNDLTQEVKEAMTGGAVAVVGVGAVDTVNVKDGTITPEKTTFVSHSKNLYNKETSIDYTTLTKGGITESTDRTTSDFIQVEGDTTYVSNHHAILQQYRDSFVELLGPRDLAPTIPQLLHRDTKYVKVSPRINTKNEFQLEKGSVPTEYERYGIYIENLLGVEDLLADYLTAENEGWAI